MARRKRSSNHLLQRAALETQVRYGPEERALQELQSQATSDLRFQVKSARGTAAGIGQAVTDALQPTRNYYDEARRSLADVGSDVAQSGGLQGVIAQVAGREQAGAQRRLATSRAADLSGLQQRKVGAAEGAVYATQNAAQEFRKTSASLNRQRVGLAADEGAFTQSNFADLQDAQVKVGQENQRIKIALAGLRDKQRRTEATITGVDPSTGLPTADEANRRRDDQARAKRGGRTVGEVKDHRSIVKDIQNTRADARDERKNGLTWNQVGAFLRAPADKDANPRGGHDPLVTKAAVELERSGVISQSTMRALKARGFIPRKAPPNWRSGSHGSAHGIVGGAQDAVGRLFG